MKGKPHARQKKSCKNKLVFKLLMNKSPLSRICEVADIDPVTLYRKIQYIRDQCEQFTAHREKRLFEGDVVPSKVQISVDQQFNFVNWPMRKDKRNVQIYTIASADNLTGYVFNASSNFDPLQNGEEIERKAEAIGDPEKLAPFRKYARVWLQKDYRDARLLSAENAKKDEKKLSRENAPLAEDAIEEKENNFEGMSPGLRIPSKGMQVHAEYTAFANFKLLGKMLEKVRSLNFYLDCDYILSKGCLYFFRDKVKTGECRAFFVSINKNYSIDQKRSLLQKSKKMLAKESLLYPSLDEWSLKNVLVAEKIDAARLRYENALSHGARIHPWVEIPFPRMDEPEKKVLLLSGFKNAEKKISLSESYLRAGLYGVDTFFQQIRRRISLLERPISSSSSAGRRWSGYSPYNPGMVQNLVTIMRTFHNFVLPSSSEDKRTPAMKLGLAKGPVTMEKILYFRG